MSPFFSKIIKCPDLKSSQPNSVTISKKTYISRSILFTVIGKEGRAEAKVQFVKNNDVLDLKGLGCIQMI